MFRKIFYFLTFICVVFFIPGKIQAIEFQKDYSVDYYLQETPTGIETKAVFNLKITNLTGEVIIKTFGLAFPKSFTIRNLQASNNGQPIDPEVTQGEQDIKIQVNLPNAEVGRGTANNIKLEFAQDNLFKVNGNVWEVILPTIDIKDRNSYKVSVHLPSTNGKKIAISKPLPDNIQENVVTWNNPMSKTIYAVFGETQLYESKLTYHLNNPKLTPVYTDIALIPETAFQSTRIRKLSPQPSLVYLDEDGNYMARYILKPRESYEVVYDGVVALHVKPRDEVRVYTKEQISRQQKYLTQTPGFWQNKESRKFASVEEVYKHITSSFSYNYDRVTQDVKRLGAQVAFTNPANAVCTEFTDGFVALARNNKFLAREIQGFGFSSDPQLRPLSLESDVLHAWPEYFDQEQQLWIPVDPTWENTSGIDYFNSFDLNHITFVIHGKRPDYPYPAGTYKQKDSKDIEIKATSVNINKSVKYVFEEFNGNRRIYPDKIYTGNIKIKNTGNTFAWNVPVYITSDILKITLPDQKIAVIAPYEEKTIAFTYKSASKTTRDGYVDVSINDKKLSSIKIQVTPLVLDIALTALPVLLIVGGVGLYILKGRRKNNLS